MSDLRRAIERHVRPIHEDPEVPRQQPEPATAAVPKRKVGWMKVKVLGFVLGLLGQKLDGKKTLIGGVGLIMLGLTGILEVMFPDQGLPKLGLEVSLTHVVAGFSVLGLGGKAEKLKTAVAGKEGG